MRGTGLVLNAHQRPFFASPAAVTCKLAPEPGRGCGEPSGRGVGRLQLEAVGQGERGVLHCVQSPRTPGRPLSE